MPKLEEVSMKTISLNVGINIFNSTCSSLPLLKTHLSIMQINQGNKQKANGINNKRIGTGCEYTSSQIMKISDDLPQNAINDHAFP